MVHLTNDYRKLLRKNGPKAALSLCVALALSGGLVSAEGKTYDDVNQWGREALEGDPIEVVHMGSGDGDVQAGTDITNKVIVHGLGTYKNENTKETPNAYVKGHMIEILGDLVNSGGGKVSIGGDTTDSVDIKGILNNNSNSNTVVVNGTEITSGYTGNWGGSLSIGNDKTESVIMDGFGSSNKAKNLIQGGTISTGSLGVWGADASFKADREFKVAKDGNTQDIGVTNGGTLSVTAGSVEAGKVDVSGDGNVGSKAEFHVMGNNGAHFTGSLYATKNSQILMHSPAIHVDGKIGVTASSLMNLQGDDLYVDGNLDVIDSEFKADEGDHVEIGNADTTQENTVSSSSVLIGIKSADVKLYGYSVITGNYVCDNEKSKFDSSFTVQGKRILVDQAKSNANYAIRTTNEKISIGNENSDLTINGGILGASSSVTLDGERIYVKSSGDLNNTAIMTTGAPNKVSRAETLIGHDGTEEVRIDGTVNTNASNSYNSSSINENALLQVLGNKIVISNPKGTAVDGGNKSEIHIGNDKTSIANIKGQVANNGAAEMKLSGQHIAVDSTEYDGSENVGQYPHPQAVLAFSNDIDAGTEHTKTININGGLDAMGGDIHVLGKEIIISASDYFKTHEVKIWDSNISKYIILKDSYIAHASGGNVTIGSDDSDMVHLYGSQLLADGDKKNNNNGHIKVQGHNILIDGNDTWAGWTNKGTLTIGTPVSDSVRIQGGIHAQGIGGAVIQGKQITISSNDENRYALESIGGDIKVGGSATESIDVVGGIHALGGEADIKGKQISIYSDVQNALENDGAPIVVGGPDTQAIHVSGGIVSHGSQITLKGRSISISKGKEKLENAIHAIGGTVSIHSSSDEEAHISGPVVNDYGVIDFSFSGKSSYLKSNQITDNTPGTVRADSQGYLHDRNGKMLRDPNGQALTIDNTKDIPDEAIEGIWLSLHNQASWEPSKDSNIYSYNGDEGHIRLDNEAHQTITASKFNDNGTRIHEDIYGSGNTGNDAIHIDKSYTGSTHFWLVNREGTDKGVVGTVLASALKKDAVSTGNASGAKALMMAANPIAAPTSNPIADFQADHFKAFGMNSLYFKTYGLGVKDSEGDTADYTKDLYITGVTNHTTNEHGQYTPTASTALSGSSLMYYTWRTENDKMLQRVGDLRENEGEETGLWARIRGSRIGKSHSDRGFKNQYKVYEIGYDAKTEDNDRMKSFTGIAFSYLDGKGYYADGRGTNQAASAAIYHTDIHKTGHYLDLVFRIRHMNERLHTHTTVDADIGPITEDHSASMDTTGLSFSAEYGRKKFVGNGWYVEPQTQWTLGYLGPNQYEMDNGTRVEQPGITSFVGRVGFNLGRQVNPNSIVYLKANVYHEFGGHSPIHLYAGDESLSFTDTFDDTWFEYGVGFAMKLGSRLSLYGDFEKSAGSHFYKDWQWNAGIRYSF